MPQYLYYSVTLGFKKRVKMTYILFMCLDISDLRDDIPVSYQSKEVW